MDLHASALQHIFRRNVSDRAVQALVVIVSDVLAGHRPAFLQRQRHAGPDALALDRLIPALYLPVGLRIIRSGPHVRHPGDPNELLEVFGDELWTVVGDDSRPGLGELLLRPLQQNLDLSLRHRFPQIPFHDVAAGSVEHRAQIVEGAVNIDVRDVDVPVLVRGRGLLKASPFLGRPPAELTQPARLMQHPVDARRTYRYGIGVDHHVSQAAVAFHRILRLKVENLPLLPVPQPKIAGNPTVVLVGLAVAFSPLVILTGGDAEPLNELLGGDFGLL